MKLSIFTLAAVLATNSFAFAENNRAFFDDGSPENTYIAGQQNSANVSNDIKAPKNFNGRNKFGDGSVENGYTAGKKIKFVTTSRHEATDEGRNGFGDGSPLN